MDIDNLARIAAEFATKAQELADKAEDLFDRFADAFEKAQAEREEKKSSGRDS